MFTQKISAVVRRHLWRFHGTLKTLLMTKIWVSLFPASNYILYFHWDRGANKGTLSFSIWWFSSSGNYYSLFEYGLKSQSHLRRLDCPMLKLRSAISIMIETPRTFSQVVIQYFQPDDINPGLVGQSRQSLHTNVNPGIIGQSLYTDANQQNLDITYRAS